MKDKRKESSNKGFTLTEVIIVVAILSVIIGIIAPQYLKWVEKTKRVADVHTAKEIKKAYDKAIAFHGEGTTGHGSQHTGAVIWTPKRKMPTEGDPTNKLADWALLELGEVPISKVNKEYNWFIQYDGRTGVVTYIYLIDCPTKITKMYELYPDSSKFLSGK